MCLVIPEEYRSGQFATLGRNVGVLKVERLENGSWRIYIEVELEVRLLDGRIVKTKHPLTVPGLMVSPKTRQPKTL